MVETEGAYKEEGGKDMGSFGCIDASGKIFKDFNDRDDYSQFKCICQKKKCNWLFLVDTAPEKDWCNSGIKCKEASEPGTCYNCCSGCDTFCMNECVEGTLMLDTSVCSQICFNFKT